MAGVEPLEKYALFQIFLNENSPMRIWMTPRAGRDDHFAMVTCTASGRGYARGFRAFYHKGPLCPLV